MNGSPIHMEAIRAAGADDTTFVLYRAGSSTAFTLDAGDSIEVTDVQLVHTSGGAYAVVADTDAAGRRIAKGNAAANGGISFTLQTPYACPRGVTPVLIADDGAVACIMRGTLSQA